MDFSVEPKNLVFKKTLKKQVIVIRNHSTIGAGFIVKTNVPNKYKIKPHIGVLLPLQDIEIEIFAIDLDHNTKFLVEIYEFDWRRSLNELIKSVESKNLDLIYKQKIDVSIIDDSLDEDLIDFADFIVCFIGLLGFIKIAKEIM
ncbi:Vesicle-associated protein 1-1 [Dictyocoela muelleri]|nr:Vesicle-associated protein 1-1 [Dictyocoela muelleri]